MKKISALLCGALLCSLAYAQLTFQKAIGDFNYNDAACVKQTVDGGYIIAGTYAVENARIYVVKTDSLANVTWAKYYTYFGEVGTSIQQTMDGGYIMSAVYFDVPYKTYLLKLNAVGDTLWSKMIYNDNHDIGYSVMETSDGSYVTAGVTTDGVNYVNARLTKFSANGTTIWNKGYTSAFNYLEQIPYSTKQANDGGYVAAGYLNNSFTAYDMVLMKTDSGGVYQWNKWYGGNDTDYAYCVQPTSDNGYILVGETQSFGAGGKDVFVVKTNSTGDTLWTRPYGGSGNDVGKSVVQANDGGYVIAGFTESFGAGYRDVYVIKLNSSGAVQWSRTFGGMLNDEAASIQKTSDGGYIIAGYTESYGLNRDIYLIKLDSLGNSFCNQANAATQTGMPFTQTGLYGLISGVVGYIANQPWVRGLGGSTTEICTVGINENADAGSLEIYPNPTHNQLNVECKMQNGSSTAEIKIYDLAGRIVLEEELLFQLSTYKLQLPAGIYVVRVEAGQKVYRRKLVIE